jgi:nucleotide-binding universal stress UspA family protein
LRDADVVAVVARAPRLERSRDSASSSAARDGKLRDQLEAVRRAIIRTAEGAPVRIEVMEGTAVTVLLALTDRVDLLVVGGHGYGGWKSVLSTSVSEKLAIHTKAALCVVREFPTPAHGRIVVGYDGPNSESAVAFAAEEAERCRASLTVVCSWHYAVRDTRADAPETAGLLEEGATAALEPAVRQVRRIHHDLQIDPIVQMGQPVEVLADLSTSADLLVVGSHGRGELATLVVGSVARGVLQRVRTPVVIVPHR